MSNIVQPEASSAPVLVHRDLSWLQFNERVLAEANDLQVPAMERLKFLSITASNLDEFFMIRFPSVLNDKETAVRDQILIQATEFLKRQEKCLASLQELFLKEGFEIIRDKDRLLEHGAEIFEKQIAGDLRIISDFSWKKSLSQIENHRSCFLFQENLLYLAPLGIQRFFWKRISSKETQVFFADDLIAASLTKFHPKSLEPARFRFTRDADVRVDIESEDPESIPDRVRNRIRARDQGRWVRAQLFSGSWLSPQMLSSETKLSEDRVFTSHLPFALAGGLSFVNALQSELKDSHRHLFYPSLKSYIPKGLAAPKTLFSGLARRDYLLHHPFDSFDSLVNFIRAAVEDPKVVSIQQTIYRVDSLSEIVSLLKQGARTKRVRVIIEPRARFDELNNIELAEELRQAGAEVIFPFGEIKIHAKLTLIERQEGEELKRYTHLATGNYNSQTARLYTDFGILTAHQGIGEDAASFFDKVADAEIPKGFQCLLLAPTELHKRLLSLIQAETKSAQQGVPARIFAKVNALVDHPTIKALCEASQAGVKVDLIVRGACSLVPKIPGVSENIRVYSIVDRFLEHSRLYYFQCADQLYMSSADWMPRNFFSRLEIAFPVVDQRIKNFIIEDVIPIYLGDSVKARELLADGSWRKRSSGKSEPLRSQSQFEELARRGYKDTALAR